ncbi:serine/threonine protein kinase [Amycolatopsis sp.]|uniref:serine/threonine protein kinase n=1 Tax=Amycolatopsis sp. TaxID=37632 RepID=UPI002D7EA7E3|nr:protein kinase [Amycolatopsis sp.]HET6706640.1 protein kinase [Amycolatopsis sp.]
MADTEHGELVPLGEGPVAQVLAGVHGTTGEAFALKVYPGKLDRRTRDELDKELSALAELRGLGTALVPDEVWELADGRCGIRMELCAQSLPELVAAFGPLSTTDTLALGEALASALAEAHQAGLVHGGVTPGNVLFRPSGAPVLADFGLTLRQVFPRDLERGVEYLAPETVRDGTIDERTDLYGLGAVLYLALSGRPPHQGRPGEPADAVTLRVLNGDVTPPARPDLPAGLAHLVSSLLAGNPDARPIDAALVVTRLGALIGPTVPGDHPAPGASGTVPPPGPARELVAEYGPAAGPPRKRRTALTVAAVAGAAALAVVAVLVSTNRPAELSVPPAPSPTTARPTPPVATQVDLATPADHDTYVDLSWRSSTPDLDYAVVVAPEGKPNHIEYVRRETSHRVDVEPSQKYCFVIQGTNSLLTVQSAPQGIRGARCTQ